VGTVETRAVAEPAEAGVGARREARAAKAAETMARAAAVAEAAMARVAAVAEAAAKGARAAPVAADSRVGLDLAARRTKMRPASVRSK
jgi:hypothetical protein